MATLLKLTFDSDSKIGSIVYKNNDLTLDLTDTNMEEIYKITEYLEKVVKKEVALRLEKYVNTMQLSLDNAMNDLMYGLEE